MPRVLSMHFICREDLNVVVFDDHTFETGFWLVAEEHARSVRTLALHANRTSLSYRQGRVIGRRPVEHQGKVRWVFRVLEDGRPTPWEGGGAGEKGFGWG